MLFAQYLSPMLVFTLAAWVAIGWPWWGGALHLIAAVTAVRHFRGPSVLVLYPRIVAPLVSMALAYAYGRPHPKRWAMRAILGLPLITLIGFGVEPVIRPARRVDDGDRGARHIEVGAVDLIWAPFGPGWPLDGVSWEEARRRCEFLAADGSAWPSRRWESGGCRRCRKPSLRCTAQKARYDRRPDKESPLWDPTSKIIYWWTATDFDEDEAWIVVCNGGAWSRTKSALWGHLGFRAVKEPDRP